MTVSDEDREFIVTQLVGLDAATALIKSQQVQFVHAFRKIADAEAALMERFDVEVLTRCEGCSTYLLSGDVGSRSDDGTFCEQCSPTWEDLKAQHEDCPEIFEEEQLQFGREALAKHLASGGSLTDKLTAPL